MVNAGRELQLTLTEFGSPRSLCDLYINCRLDCAVEDGRHVGVVRNLIHGTAAWSPWSALPDGVGRTVLEGARHHPSLLVGDHSTIGFERNEWWRGIHVVRSAVSEVVDSTRICIAWDSDWRHDEHAEVP